MEKRNGYFISTTAKDIEKGVSGEEGSRYSDKAVGKVSDYVRIFRKSVFFDTNNEYCIKDRKAAAIGGIYLKADLVSGSHIYLQALRRGKLGRNGTTVSNLIITIPEDSEVLKELGRTFIKLAEQKEN